MVLMSFTTTIKKKKMTSGNDYPQNKDYKLLYDRVSRMKIETMMEEPCPLYEPGWEDVTNSPEDWNCLLYTSPSPRDYAASRMPSSA